MGIDCKEEEKNQLSVSKKLDFNIEGFEKNILLSNFYTFFRFVLASVKGFIE